MTDRIRLRIPLPLLARLWRACNELEIAWRYGGPGTDVPGTEGRIAELIDRYVEEEVLARDDLRARAFIEAVVETERSTDPREGIVVLVDAWLDRTSVNAEVWVRGQRDRPAWADILKRLATLRQW